MSGLARIVYYSRSCMDGAAPFSPGIRRLLVASRAANARASITGALICGAGTFAQVLEGPPDAVAATFARIGRDPRHSHVRLIESTDAEARLFANWAMAYADGTDRADIFLQRIQGEIGDTAKDIIEMLRWFVRDGD